MLSGCAGRPENVLQPVALTTNDTSRVDMLVATTRKPAADPGELYSGERGTAISLNNLTVSIPPDEARKVGEVQWPKRVPPNPEKEFAVNGGVKPGHWAVQNPASTAGTQASAGRA